MTFVRLELKEKKDLPVDSYTDNLLDLIRELF